MVGCGGAHPDGHKYFYGIFLIFKNPKKLHFPQKNMAKIGIIYNNMGIHKKYYDIYLNA